MKKQLSADEYLNGIKNKEISILAKAITLVESRNIEHQKIATQLLRKILPLTGNAKRIGISGTPGVGKSTFLENFGMFLIDQGQSIAVLAIDPTSQITGGSILGDKTRMSELSANENAFIRYVVNEYAELNSMELEHMDIVEHAEKVTEGNVIKLKFDSDTKGNA